MAKAETRLVVDWERPARPHPQAALERFAPEIALAAARKRREEARARPAPRPGRQAALDEGVASGTEIVALELKPSMPLKSVYITQEPGTGALHRKDEPIRDAIQRACKDGATRDEAILAAARECAVPTTALSLVENLLDDLVLEGALQAYGNALFSRPRRGRRVVAVDVEEEELLRLLAAGHRVVELK